MAYHSKRTMGKTKFIDDDIVAISKMLEMGISISTIARQYNTSKEHIRQVKLHLISKG